MALGADINREVRQVGAVVKLLARRVVAEPDGRVPRTADARADSIEIIVPYPSLGSASAAHIYTCGKRERESMCVCGKMVLHGDSPRSGGRRAGAREPLQVVDPVL